MKQKLLKPVQSFFRWLFGAPFRTLPPEFGDPVPPELRAFEAEAEEIQHHPGKESLPSSPVDSPKHNPR